MPILAAGAHTAVKGHVVADHADAGERVRTIADQGRALDGVLDFAVLNPVGFTGRKHKLAAGDVDLTTTEVDCGSLSPPSI